MALLCMRQCAAATVDVAQSISSGDWQVGIFGGYGKPRWQDTLGFHTVYAPIRLAKVRELGTNRLPSCSYKSRRDDP